MNFPEQISTEEMPLRRKEWEVAGIAVGDTDKYVIVFSVPTKTENTTALCEYIYELSGDTWYRTAGKAAVEAPAPSFACDGKQSNDAGVCQFELGKVCESLD